MQMFSQFVLLIPCTWIFIFMDMFNVGQKYLAAQHADTDSDSLPSLFVLIIYQCITQLLVPDILFLHQLIIIILILLHSYITWLVDVHYLIFSYLSTLTSLHIYYLSTTPLWHHLIFIIMHVILWVYSEIFSDV